MYGAIKSRKSIPQKYEDSLIDAGIVTREEVDTLRKEYMQELIDCLESSYSFSPTLDSCSGKWTSMSEAGAPERKERKSTGVDIEVLKQISRKSVEVPKDFVRTQFDFNFD